MNLIHYRHEGEKMAVGINYTPPDKFTAYAIAIYLKFITIYLRKRSEFTAKANARRYIFHFYINYAPNFYGAVTDFGTRSLIVNGKKISLELLEDLSEDIYNERICDR